jgi:hypothetical protein
MMNWKGCRRKRSWCNLRNYYGICLEEEENHENLSQDSRCPGRDLNPGPLRYEAGVLTILPQHSVVEFYEIQQGDHATADDFDAIVFSPVTSAAIKRLTFKI